MKFRCPHCKNNGISAFSKLGAHSLGPARCSNCGCHSVEPIQWQRAKKSLWAITGLSVFVSVLVVSLLPVLIGLSANVMLSLATLFTVNLRPITNTEVRSGQLKFLFAVLAILGLAIYGYIAP